MARDIYEDHDEVEVEDRGATLASALVIMTTVLLLIAVFAVQWALKEDFNQGLFKEGEGGIDAVPVQPEPEAP